MDTTEQYIKMCEKAWPDIGHLPSNGCPSQLITKDRKQWGDGCLLLSDTIDDDVIGQVYRQDQLQAKIDPNPDNWDDVLLVMDIFRQHDYPINVDWDYIDSHEKMWLHCVMAHNYQKTWNGDTWVKE